MFTSSHSTKLALATCKKCNLSPVFQQYYLHRVKHPTILPHASITCSSIRNDSYARKLALGKIDMNWVFPYPTLLKEEALSELNEYAERVASFFSDHIDSDQLDKCGVMGEEIMQGLKDLGLFGLTIPTNYGGKGLTHLEFVRLCEETSANPAINTMLRAHQIEGVQAIVASGTEEQKNKYLPKFASGEYIAALCLKEKASESDIGAIECEARLSDDGKQWILNGEKHWVVNGGIADVMTVFAKTDVTDLNNEVTQKTTAFIVERSFGGVTSKRIDTLGIKAADICNVTFEDTVVPVDNVLGDVGNGFALAVSCVNCGRVGIGASVATQLKHFVATATERNSRLTRFGRRLSEHPLMQRKVWRMAVNAYACESMAYMTAFQMDQEDEEGLPKDCSVEAAIVKVFSAERGWQSLNDFMEIIGTDAYDCAQSYERLLRDAKVLSLLEGTHDTLRLFISLASLQHAVMHQKDRIRALRQGSIRERLTFLLDTGREDLRLMTNFIKVPNPSFGWSAPAQTKTWLDPSLSDMGKCIEHLVDIYRRRVFVQLHKRGKFLEEEQQKLVVFADIAINIFAMTAVLSRCNKALLLNLRNSDHDRLLAYAFIKQTYKDTFILLDDLYPGNPHLYTEFEKKACRELTDERRYLSAHPLEVAHKYTEHPKYIEQLNRLKARIAG